MDFEVTLFNVLEQLYIYSFYYTLILAYLDNDIRYNYCSIHDCFPPKGLNLLSLSWDIELISIKRAQLNKESNVLVGDLLVSTRWFLNLYLINEDFSYLGEEFLS